jgi:hypothetical protein
VAHASLIRLTGLRAHEWLCVGGFQLPTVRPLSSVSVYNMMDDTWRHDSMRTTGCGGTALAMITTSSSSSYGKNRGDGKDGVISVGTLYAFGGSLSSQNSDISDQCEVYNCNTRVWTRLTKRMRTIRSEAAAIWIPHWHAFVITGGYGYGRQAMATIEVYVPATNTFTSFTSSQWQLPSPQAGHHLQLMNDTILIMIPSSTHMPYSSMVANGWIIDVSSYATLHDITETRVALSWQPLPLTCHYHDDGVKININSSFIITI